MLVVAATDSELAFVEHADTLCCGIGPVEAALATAAALARRRPSLVLHVGIAGARSLPPPTLVLGSEAVYCDASGPSLSVPRLERSAPDPALLAAARRALPAAHVTAIGTTARIGGCAALEVEAMEGFGVLRAAASAGVPALELRAVSNAYADPRTLWQVDEALEALAAAVHVLIGVLDASSCPPPLPPQERTVGQLIGRRSGPMATTSGARSPLGVPLALVDQAAVHSSGGRQILIFWAAGAARPSRPMSGPACSSTAAAAGGRRGWSGCYLPARLLRLFYLLPGVAWFGLIGLAVPAALAEAEGVPGRACAGIELGRADLLHAIGSLAALVIVVGVGEDTLSALLHTQGEASARAALALADVVLSPLLYLGGAMLYLDQAARVGVARSSRARPRPERDSSGESEAPGKAGSGV